MSLMRRLLLALAFVFCASNAFAATYTTNFGLKTRNGHGGLCVSETAGATNFADFVVDSGGCIVPSGTYGSQHSYTKTLGQTYSLVLPSGATADVTMVNGFHVRSLAADSSTSNQLYNVLFLAWNVAGAPVLGDTIYIRDGSVFNPGGGVWRLKANSGGYTGGGTITNSGTGYTNTTGLVVPLTGGSGTGATARIIVTGNVATQVHIMNPGSGYVQGDVLGATALPGGTGFAYTVINLGGRITIRSETPNATTDPSGNLRRGGAARIGAALIDGATSGHILYPWDLKYLDFTWFLDGAHSSFLTYATSNGYGVSVYESRFENDSATISKANATTDDGFWNRSGRAENNYFKFLGFGIKNGSLNSGITTANVGNVFEAMISDGMQMSGNNLLITDNFGFNYDFYTGAHPDGFQHLGFQGTRVAGSGYTPGTQTCPSNVASGTNCYLNVPLTTGSSTGVLADMQVTGGVTALVVKNLGNLTKGVAVVLTIDPSAPAGLLAGTGFQYTTVGTISNFGEIARNTFVRNIGPAGLLEAQGVFLDDTVDTGVILGANIHNNFTLLTAQNGLTGTRFNDPTISFNTILTGQPANYNTPFNSLIGFNSGTGGILTGNIASQYSVQTGMIKPTQTNPTMAKVSGSYVPTYNAWFQAYTETITTPTIARVAFSPILNGPAKNPDGTYNGRWFPDGSENDGSVYLASPDTSITSSAPAASVPAGGSLTITFQLNAAASQALVITPAASGVSYTFSPATVSIALGGVSGTTSFNPTTAGNASITATNSRTLSNPTPLAITVDAAPSPPTSYSFSLTTASILLGRSTTLTAVLNQPATLPVTLTWASTLAGSFSQPTSVIQVGFTQVSVSFSPSMAGTGVLSSTNDRSLTNPSAIAVAAYRNVMGQLVRLGIR